MKTVVTGGSGFIGSNVVDMLIEQGHDVTIIDNLSTGKKENINPKALFYKLDISDFSEHFNVMIKHILSDVDVIFHLAALPRVEPSIINPTESHKINVDGTFNIFWAAKEAGIKTIVFSSSSSIYGEAKNHPTKETEPPNPMSPYALQKLINEQYAKLFCELYDMNITCLRYFNVWGNREPTEGSYVPVIGIWLRQLLSNQSLTITSDGKQARDFVNVEDVARANIACYESNLKGFNVFNVGSGKAYELNELARLISTDIKYIAPRIEPRYTLADVSALSKETGWTPQVSIGDYLQRKLEK